MDYLAKLNAAQKEAVTNTLGPLLVVAGAGTGKTRVITYRLLHLLKSGVPAEQILAVTFTNKAATEMRERVKDLWAGQSPMISTFHRLGVYLLRENYQILGLNKNFSILDRDDSVSAIKEAAARAGVGEKLEARKILGAISWAKGQGLDRNKYLAEATDTYQKLVARVWAAYQQILIERRALDFDDLLLTTVKLLTEHKSVQKKYQDQFKYLAVDEYQDTNPVQYQLIKLLVGPAKNICVVGDIDQSIYGWRGANFSNILEFEHDYPEAKVIVLEENYRSTSIILAAANAAIAKNLARKEKKLFTGREGGEKITLVLTPDERAEAELVVAQSQALMGGGVVAEEIAVLYRTNFQSRVIEEEFLRAGLPYQVVGTRFFERKEVKDVLAYVRFALNRSDWGSLKRIINLPPRGIGKVTLAKLAAGQKASLAGGIQEKINKLEGELDQIKNLADQEPPAIVLKQIIAQMGLEKMFKASKIDGEERWANVGELVSLATKYNNLPPADGMSLLLEEAALASDQDDLLVEKKGVKLMTIHAAKGLEFKAVFLVGLEQGLFPHTGLDESHDPEEERRLFYVALTRAKDRLFLVSAQTRTIYGRTEVHLPSEFIFDVPEDLIIVADHYAPILTIN